MIFKSRRLGGVNKREEGRWWREQTLKFDASFDLRESFEPSISSLAPPQIHSRSSSRSRGLEAYALLYPNLSHLREREREREGRVIDDRV